MLVFLPLIEFAILHSIQKYFRHPGWPVAQDNILVKLVLYSIARNPLTSRVPLGRDRCRRRWRRCHHAFRFRSGDLVYTSK